MSENPREFVFILQWFVSMEVCSVAVIVSGLPAGRRTFGYPVHLFPSPLRTRNLRAVPLHELQPPWWDVLSRLREEVEGVERVDVLLEVLRVRSVEKHHPLERLIADLLRRDRRTCNDPVGQMLREEGRSLSTARDVPFRSRY